MGTAGSERDCASGHTYGTRSFVHSHVSHQHPLGDSISAGESRGGLAASRPPSRVCSRNYPSETESELLFTGPTPDAVPLRPWGCQEPDKGALRP